MHMHWDSIVNEAFGGDAPAFRMCTPKPDHNSIYRRPGGGGGGNENNPPPPPEGLSLPNRFVLPPDFPTFFPSFPGILIVNVCPSFRE